MPFIPPPYVPPPPPPIVQNCNYQVKINSDLYRCFTEEEFTKYQRDEQRKRDEIHEENINLLKGLLRKWYFWLGVVIVLFFIGVAIFSERNPYDNF